MTTIVQIYSTGKRNDLLLTTADTQPQLQRTFLGIVAVAGVDDFRVIQEPRKATHPFYGREQKRLIEMPDLKRGLRPLRWICRTEKRQASRTPKSVRGHVNNFPVLIEKLRQSQVFITHSDRKKGPRAA